MLGHIESYDKDIQTGIIKADDKFFEFHIDNWTAEDSPKVGDDVDFLEEEGEVIEVDLVGAYIKDIRPVKRRSIAVTLALILGAIGAHRFYLGFYGLGVIQIIVTFVTGGYGLMWGFIEGVLLFAGHLNKDAKGRPLK